MMMLRALLLVLALAGPVAAQGRMLEDAEAASYRAIGRLNIAGRRFCTATMISPREAVTAAHCLYHPRTGRRVPLRELRFVAGLRRGEPVAVRRIAAAAAPEDFELDEGSIAGVRGDVALLALAAPVLKAPPLAVARAPVPGAAVSIVAYARNRPQAPSIQECRMARFAGVAAVSCPIDFGASGAPVLAGTRVVAVVSAIGRLGPAEFAFAVPLVPQLAELRASLAARAPDVAR
jgi:hypothetical protein